MKSLDQPAVAFLYSNMLTYRRHRYVTRWNRRAVFAVAILLLLALSWRAYHAWQRAQPSAPVMRGQLAYH